MDGTPKSWIDVTRPDGEPLAIDDERLRMEGRGLPFVHPHAGVKERVIPGTPCQPDDVDVGTGTCGEDAHIDATSRGGSQLVDETAVRREVRIGDIERPACAGDRQGEETSGRGTADRRRRVQQARRCDSILLGRQCRAARVQHARRFYPCRRERGLELSNGGSFEADVRFAP